MWCSNMLTIDIVDYKCHLLNLLTYIDYIQESTTRATESTFNGSLDIMTCKYPPSTKIIIGDLYHQLIEYVNKHGITLTRFSPDPIPIECNVTMIADKHYTVTWHLLHPRMLRSSHTSIYHITYDVKYRDKKDNMTLNDIKW